MTFDHLFLKKINVKKLTEAHTHEVNEEACTLVIARLLTIT